ncbi:MAG: hypothetical protein LBH43_20015 [Treponema sp.]|jgi:hypothetical protein|nr:hypothetical protein [Treponema sp.]
METHINFDDNIFILNAEIRMILDILSLDAEPSLFLEKIMAELDFIDRALAFIGENLIGNEVFIDREEVLEKLADLEWRFDQLLTGMCGNSASISASRFPEIKQKLDTYREQSSHRRLFIESARTRKGQPNSEPLVSSHELNELLRDL